jgi:hypothetical protein
MAGAGFLVTPMGSKTSLSADTSILPSLFSDRHFIRKGESTSGRKHNEPDYLYSGCGLSPCNFLVSSAYDPSPALLMAYYVNNASHISHPAGPV